MLSLCLHIGTHKRGTTTIQQAMLAGRAASSACQTLSQVAPKQNKLSQPGPVRRALGRVWRETKGKLGL